jgi:hypothetical protein
MDNGKTEYMQAESQNNSGAGRICRLSVILLDYQSRLRQEAVNANRTMYSRAFGPGRRDSLAARVDGPSSRMEP